MERDTRMREGLKPIRARDIGHVRLVFCATLLVLLVVPGCNDGDHGNSSACAPSEDTTGTLYEVLEQSVLARSSGNGVVTEGLTGSFRLLALPPDPNVELGFEVRAVRLCGQTSQLTIEGDDSPGFLGIFGDPGPLIGMNFRASVNGEEAIVFDGRGPYHLDDKGMVVLDGLEICGPPLPPLRCESFETGMETGIFLEMFAAPSDIDGSGSTD